MATARKPRPDFLTRDQAAEMIAEAVAAERKVQAASKPLNIKTYPTFRKK